MRAAIYARVSKDDEGKSDSVPVQLSECRAFAAQQGLTVVAEFSDDGISGYARGNRPGFLSLMQAVAARESMSSCSATSTAWPAARTCR
jgi:site-specific DNA recombinase